MTEMDKKIISKMHKEIEGRENSFFCFLFFRKYYKQSEVTFGTNVNRKVSGASVLLMHHVKFSSTESRRST
ncbi:MAG: hypothetical protein DRJ01_18985 [Bacteroidetes bacterium]|nr:MAG: hypothetical protein DRJ01_18985 [Bacteroidota bacterium]